MTTYTSVNEINPKTDQTVKIFDEFYLFESQVPSNEYDVVNSFFKSVFQDEIIAANFTTTLFRAAQESQTPVLDLLQSLQGQNQMELTATLCYYINGLRSLSTLLGIGQVTLPNYYAARNVIQ